MLGYKFGTKPSVVLIEKWIASNEAQGNDNGNECHVVDCDGNSETNAKSTPHEVENESLDHVRENNESDANEGYSPADDSSPRADDDNVTAEVQQLIDDPESAATLLMEINRISKSERKSRKKKMKSEERIKKKSSSSSFAPRAAKYLKNDQFFDVSYKIALQNDVEQQEQESNQNLTEISLSPNMIHGHRRHDKCSATVSTPSIFEVGHDLYEAMVNKTKAAVDGNSNTEVERDRPVEVETYNEENNNDSCNSDDAISQDIQGNYPGKQLGTQSVQAVEDDSTDPTHYESNRGDFGRSEEMESQYESTTQNQFYDESNGPLDFCTRGWHHAATDSVHELPNNSNFDRNEWFNGPATTVRLGFGENDQPDGNFDRTELFNSPAGTLRMGFAVNEHPDGGYSQFPDSFRVDEQPGTYQSNLHYPIPQRNSGYPLHGPSNKVPNEFSLNEHVPTEQEDVLQDTNGVNKHTTRTSTSLETVEAYSQTDASSNASEDKCCKMLMENNNLNLTAIMYFLFTINQQAFNFITPLVPLTPTTPTTSDSQGNVSHPQRECSSNQKANSHSTVLLTETTGNRKRKRRRFKGVPQKRSKRLSEMALKRDRETVQSAVETGMLEPPKEMKKSKNGDVAQKFTVENLENPPNQNQPSDDVYVVAVPRKLKYENDCFNSRTPHRLSKYLRTRKINNNNQFKKMNVLKF